MIQLTLVLALLASLGIAQAASHEDGMTHDMSSHAAPAATHQGTGVVKAIKSDKVQIAHEPITSLSWPSMTMWFAVKDMPHDLRVGDHVRFDMMQGDKKQWMIVDIERK